MRELENFSPGGIVTVSLKKEKLNVVNNHRGVIDAD